MRDCLVVLLNPFWRHRVHFRLRWNLFAQHFAPSFGTFNVPPTWRTGLRTTLRIANVTDLEHHESSTDFLPGLAQPNLAGHNHHHHHIFRQSNHANSFPPHNHSFHNLNHILHLQLQFPPHIRPLRQLEPMTWRSTTPGHKTRTTTTVPSRTDWNCSAQSEQANSPAKWALRVATHWHYLCPLCSMPPQTTNRSGGSLTAENYTSFPRRTLPAASSWRSWTKSSNDVEWTLTVHPKRTVGNNSNKPWIGRQPLKKRQKPSRRPSSDGFLLELQTPPHMHALPTSPTNWLQPRRNFNVNKTHRHHNHAHRPFPLLHLRPHLHLLHPSYVLFKVNHQSTHHKRLRLNLPLSWYNRPTPTWTISFNNTLSPNSTRRTTNNGPTASPWTRPRKRPSRSTLRRHWSGGANNQIAPTTPWVALPWALEFPHRSFHPIRSPKQLMRLGKTWCAYWSQPSRWPID